MRSANKVKKIVIHCSAGFGDKASILKYWKETLGWNTVGYHRLVGLHGEIYELQSFDKITNGVAGHNTETINICYIGGIEVINKAGKKTYVSKDTRTDAQKDSLIVCIKEALKWLKKNGVDTSEIIILGHRDFSPDKNGNGVIESWERIKECPSFDAIPEYKHLTAGEASAEKTTAAHKVTAGDSLSKIAKKYGTTVEKLKTVNGLQSDTIQIGQLIKLFTLALLTGLFLSCSARKSNVTESDVKTSIKTDSTAVKTSSSNTKETTKVLQENNLTTIETTYEPENDSIPMKVKTPDGKVLEVTGGKYKEKKVFDNGKITTEKEKDQQKNEGQKIDLNKNAVTDAKKRAKDTAREEPAKTWAVSSILWAVFALALLTVAFLWYVGIIKRKKSAENA